MERIPCLVLTPFTGPCHPGNAPENPVVGTTNYWTAAAETALPRVCENKIFEFSSLRAARLDTDAPEPPQTHDGHIEFGR